MLTVAGSVMPAMVNAPGFHLANTTPPKLSPAEEAARAQMLKSVREFNAAALKHCETNDRGGAIVSGMNQISSKALYRVTIHVAPNFLLTPK